MSGKPGKGSDYVSSLNRRSIRNKMLKQFAELRREMSAIRRSLKQISFRGMWQASNKFTGWLLVGVF